MIVVFCFYDYLWVLLSGLFGYWSVLFVLIVVQVLVF